MSTALHPCSLALLSLISLTTSPSSPHLETVDLSQVYNFILTEIYSPSSSIPIDWKTWKNKFIKSIKEEEEEKCLVLLDKVERTCRDLLQGGTDAIADWTHHDLETLVSTEEDEPITEIHQSPILRTSVLGIFIRKTCLKIEKLSFKQFDQWLQLTQRWYNSDGSSNKQKQKQQDVDDDDDCGPSPTNSQSLLLTSLSLYHQKNFKQLLISLEETFKLARVSNDKPTLRGCWSLLKRVPKKWRLEFLSQSQASNSSNDTKGKGKEIESELMNPHDILFRVYHSLTRQDDDDEEEEVSIPNLFEKLYSAQSLAIASSSSNKDSNSPTTTNPADKQKKNNQKQYDTSSMMMKKYSINLETFELELRFVTSLVWDRLGIDIISKLYKESIVTPFEEQIGEEEVTGVCNSLLKSNHDIRLEVLLQQAERISSQGTLESKSQALRLLLSGIETFKRRELIGLSFPTSSRKRRSYEVKDDGAFSKWKQTVLRILEEAEEGGSREDGNTTKFKSPAISLSNSLRKLNNNKNTTTTISELIDLTLTRLEITACNSKEEAKKSLKLLKSLQNQVLISNSLATTTTMTTSTGDASIEEDEEEGSQVKTTEEMEEEKYWGEMTSGQNKKLEAKYCQVLAKLNIVASDYDDSTIKTNLPLFEKALSIYRSLSSSSVSTEEVLRIYYLLESLSIHLSLSPDISIGQSGEWRRRSERYREARESYEKEQGEEGNENEKERIDVEGVLKVVDLVEELLS